MDNKPIAKVKKSTFAIIILSILLIAMLTFGVTYAYFTAPGPSAVGGEIRTATVKLGGTVSVSYVENNIVSGESIFDKSGGFNGLNIVNYSSVETYIFLTFSIGFAAKDPGVEINQKTNKDQVQEEGDYFLEYVLKNEYNAATKPDGWRPLAGKTGVYYIKANAAGISGRTYEVLDDIKFYGYSISEGDEEGSLMGGTISVTIDIQSIQTFNEENGNEVNVQSAYTALNPGF